ncbi:MAG: FAD-dependent oxidoreductase [Lachnospiraceae bacterium]|nr:FAD-dependent oxidoreductase [Lachnospiraceae bacterium]
MILVNQIKLRPGFTEEELVKKASASLKVLPKDIKNIRIDRESIDARDKAHIHMTVNAVCEVSNEGRVLRTNANNPNVSAYEAKDYTFPAAGSETLKERPVIVGAGPAGLFAAYFLALYGYNPIVLERGMDVDARKVFVDKFWETGELNPNSNVLFGEGGAGSFSDGKLNTLVKDKEFRNKAVLDTFIQFGASPSIAYDYKPHIGTDVLLHIIKNMREAIKELGGEFRFNAAVTDVLIDKGQVKGVKINGLTELPCSCLILAIGHSARDTYEMLLDRGIHMEQKDFAVGFRVEHEQDLINRLFLTDDPNILKYTGNAAYKLTYKHSSGRGVYSFCMCPGGYVVNSSSEEGRLSVNGMSYSGRDGKHANSAMIVSVTSKDYESDHPLAGIEFQRKLEEKAYNAGSGKIPVEYYGDFKRDVLSTDDNDDVYSKFFSLDPQTKGKSIFAKVSSVLPDEMNRAFIDAMEYFGKIYPGFSDGSVLVSAVESRTSSPVRITRNDSFESVNCKGIYPVGEGAGYAGGIVSAGMDGIKAAEAIRRGYRPIKE